MELADYTTEELRNELKRRADIARAEARAASLQGPVYKEVTGMVRRVYNGEEAFSHRKWLVEVPEDFAKEHSIPREAIYYLLSGKFRKDTAPKEGDKVLIRCRVTRALPRFMVRRAKITEICND